MQNKDINKEIEMDSDIEIYLINKLEMEKLCRAKEPATISISDPRLQVGWVNFRSRGENDGNIKMVLAIYNKEKFQDSLTKQVEEAVRGFADLLADKCLLQTTKYKEVYKEMEQYLTNLRKEKGQDEPK